MNGVDTLDAIIRSDAALSRLVERVTAEASTDPAHDVWHFRRVAASARALAETESDGRLAIAAGFLHDIVHVPKNSPLRSQASELSAARATTLLEECGFAPNEVAAVAEAIRDHSWSAGRVPASELGRILMDADRLEALGAIGIMRCVATGVAMGGRMFDPEDPFAEKRPLDDKRFSLDHFYVKLLHLPATFATARGRAEAETRAAFLRGFAEQVAAELGVPPRPFP